MPVSKSRVRLWPAHRMVLIAACFAISIFFVAPLLIVIPLSFSPTEYLVFPPPEFSLRLYQDYFTSEKWMRATVTSLEVAGATTLVATIIGTLGALGLARVTPQTRTLLTGFTIAPIIVPHIIIAIALYRIFAGWRLVGTLAGLIMAHSMLTTPFVVITVAAALQSIDPNLDRAARSLGANPVWGFLRVTLPLVRPAVLSGALFAFVISFDEVVLAVFLAGSRASTLPKVMFESIRYNIEIKVAAVSSLLILLSLLGLGLVQATRTFRDRRNRIGAA